MRIRPTLIVLAAGFGPPLGAAAQKLAQARGASTVLGSTVQNALQTLLPILLVTTPHLAPLARSLAAQHDTLVLGSETASLGQAIAAGVAERSGAQGWLIVPGDLPLLLPKTLLAMATALEEHAVVQPEFEGQAGSALGFSAELYSELVQLQGREGASRIVARYPAHNLAVADPGVLRDGPAKPGAVETAGAVGTVATTGHPHQALNA